MTVFSKMLVSICLCIYLLFYKYIALEVRFFVAVNLVYKLLFSMKKIKGGPKTSSTAALLLVKGYRNIRDRCVLRGNRL